MLEKNRSFVGPLQSLRMQLSPSVINIFDQLAGTLNAPLDGPAAVRVVFRLASAFLSYALTIDKPTVAFQETITNVRQLAEELGELLHTDSTPATQLLGRANNHSAWRLLLRIEECHIQLVLALGVEAVYSLLHQAQLDDMYCRKLLSDLPKLSLPDAASPADEYDLAYLKFGLRWMPRRDRIDKEVRRFVQLPDPTRPSAKLTALQASFLAQKKFQHRMLYPSMKHRAGADDHRHVSILQLSRIANSLHVATGEGDAQAACIALQILISSEPDLVLNTPLRHARGEFWTISIDLDAGTWDLNLESVFPHRRRPRAGTEGLYLESGSVLHSPIPDFLLDYLRAHTTPAAQCIGDILGWPEIDTRANLLPAEPSRIIPSIARAVGTLTIGALSDGVPRNVAGPIAWDFSLLPSARMYYLLLAAEDVRTHWCDHLASLGWTVGKKTKQALASAGSLCCLTDAGVVQVFTHLSAQVLASKPWPNAGIARLTAHHNAYACLVAAIVVFCSGLRERTIYDITADNWCNEFALVNDKRIGFRPVDRPALIGCMVRRALADWRAHCEALNERLVQTLDGSLAPLSCYLTAIENAQPVPLLFQIHNGNVQPVGHRDVWGSLPADLAVVPNCGRPYWLNKFASAGCSTFELDIFMRHSALGLETDATTHPWALGPALQKLERIQDGILDDLFPDLPHGLRRAP